MSVSQEGMKKNAALEAAQMVDDGMVLGLGTGSTVYHVLKELSERIRKNDLDIMGVPTSTGTKTLAEKLGIPLTTLEETPDPDMDIDGADEVDQDLNLIKGGGGALVREKIVAKAAHLFVVVVDETKLSKTLGQKSPVPVETIPFALPVVAHEVTVIGGSSQIRRKKDGSGIFITDNGNFILDCTFGPISDPAMLEGKLKSINGVVDSGIFSGMADLVIVGNEAGSRTIRRPS